MKFSIFSNFFNHHQKPVCDVLFEKLGPNLTFVSTVAMPQSFKDNGYEDYSEVTYNLLSFENNENKEKAEDLIISSDVVLFGDAPFELIMPRLKMNKLTFLSTERIFKKGEYQRFDFRIILELFKQHTKFRNYNNYMLCAGAFVAADYKWVWAYPNKFFKWGYFPTVPKIDIESIIDEKTSSTFKILMVCRMIDWKHPNLALEMAFQLKENNVKFELQIIGRGELLSDLEKNIQDYELSNYVKLLGSLPNSEVAFKMRESNVLIFTSDRNEGWGAVANEAMANGCAVVGSNQIGSLPFLIKPGISGLIFKSNSSQDLTEKVLSLYHNPSHLKKICLNAYRDISNIWSPENAAKNLLYLSNSLLENKVAPLIDEGPCSKAEKLTFDWYKEPLFQS